MELSRFFKIQLSNSDGSDIINIDGTTPGLGISAGSMNLEEVLCDHEFQIGGYNSNKFEVQVYGLSYNVSGYNISVYDQVGTETPTYLFKGKIDSSKTDNKNGYRNIVAYDAMYEVRNKDVGAEWKRYWELHPHETVTLKSLREVFCAYVGFDITTSEALLNDDLLFTDDSTLASDSATNPVILVPSITSIKFSSILKMICELQCACPNITRQGQLTFIQIGSTQLPVTDISRAYNTSETEFEDYITKTPTGFSVYSSESELSQIVPSDTSVNTNPYPISGNVFILNMTSTQVTLVLTRLISSLASVVYRPATIPMIVSDFGITLGQKVTITLNSTVYTHYVWSQTLSGTSLIEQTIESPAYGETFNNTGSSENDDLVAGLKYSKLEQTVDSVRVEVGKVSGSVASLEVRADEIEQTVTDVDGRVTTVKTTVDGLTVEDAQGQTKINGEKVETSNLYVNRIWPLNEYNIYGEMQSKGLSLHLGQDGYIYLGYEQFDIDGTATNMPFLRLGSSSDAGTDVGAATVRRFKTGIWIGDDVDSASSEIVNGTGLFIDYVTNKLYKYIDGTAYVINDEQTVIATFG
jgi:hypothetical protein